MNIKKLLKIVLPNYVLVYIQRRNFEKTDGKECADIIKEIRNYFKKLETNDKELLAIKKWFKKNYFGVFTFTQSEPLYAIKLFYDEDCMMYYVMHNDKKLYFPSDLDEAAAMHVYKCLLHEQDQNSPHQYKNELFSVKNGDVIADVGSAEGIWALDNVEKAGYVYIFECTNRWIGALKKTFEPWKDKVTIMKKYVSDCDTLAGGEVDEEFISLNSFFDKKRIDVIKADIEGYEKKMLAGSKNIMSVNKNLRWIIATYHKENDAKDCKDILEQNGYKTEFSKGYMLFIYDKNLKEPYVRRGLIYAC